MAHALLLVLALSLTGCAWPSRTKPWCAPAVKYAYQKQAASIHYRCHW